MLDAVEQYFKAIGMTESERRPKVFSADAGYCSEANLGSLEDRKIDGYVATGREKYHRAGNAPHGKVPTPLALRQALCRGTSLMLNRLPIRQLVYSANSAYPCPQLPFLDPQSTARTRSCFGKSVVRGPGLPVSPPAASDEAVGNDPSGEHTREVSRRRSALPTVQSFRLGA